MKNKKVLIVIIGGGLVCDNGKWRPTTFFEKEDFQRLGDNYRIFAAVELYKKLLIRSFSPVILVSGGIGVSKDPNHPIIADILMKELIALGIPPQKILKDSETNNTYQQLLYTQDLLSKKEFNRAYIISSKYHIPRTKAMVNHAPGLTSLKNKFNKKIIKVISAESVLIKTDANQWEKEIDSIYKSAFMAERMSGERRGIRQIINKTYHFIKK